MDNRQFDIEALTRRIVERTLGQRQPPASAPSRPILDAEAVDALPPDSRQTVSPQTIITPLARQRALERRIELVVAEASGAVIVAHGREDKADKTVAIGADHGGYELKEKLKRTLAAAGYGLIDCGAHSDEAVDYPDYAYLVARLVSDGRAWRGVMIDGAGIGSCMAANKVPGVRAAMCYDQATAVNSREHNNANVLTLGAGLIGANLAGQILQTWLATEFAGGRHSRRVDKIEAIGRRYSR